MQDFKQKAGLPVGENAASFPVPAAWAHGGGVAKGEALLLSDTDLWKYIGTRGASFCRHRPRGPAA